MIRASIILFLFLASCLSMESFVSASEKTKIKHKKKRIPYGKMDISGMSKIGNNVYLLVHDTKWKNSKPRLGILTIRENSKPKYYPLSIKDVDWHHEDGPSNDLESICRIRHEEGQQFLIAESKKYDGRGGRIFHIKLAQNDKKKWAVNIVSAIPLPERIRNIEGMGCFTSATENSKHKKLYVLLGERGGKNFDFKGKLDVEVEKKLAECGIPNENVSVKEGKQLPQCGKILLWELDLENHKFTGAEPKRILSFSAPDWPLDSKNRDISDIHIDSENTLWISSAEDPGNSGPFKSVIYRAGKINPDSEMPIPNANGELMVKKVWQLDGIKVEAMAAPSVPGSGLSIGTDDENYGGIWRPLFQKGHD